MMDNRRTLAIIRKEFRHIFRDRISCLLLFVMPVTILILFGYALSFDVNHYDVAVMNPRHDPLVEGLIARLGANPTLKVVRRLERYEDIDRAMVSGNTRAVIVFGEDATDLFLDGTVPAVATNIEGIIRYVIADFYQSEQRLDTAPRPEPRARYIYNPSMNKEYMPIPGLVLMVFILVSSIVLGTSINKEKVQGTFNLLRLTPVTDIQMIFGKSLPYFLISLTHIAAVLFVCAHFHIEINGSIPLFLGMCVLFTLCCESMGILMSSCLTRPLEVVIVSWIIIFIPNVFLSGFIFPTSSMDESVRAVAGLLPGKSFIDAFRSVAYKGGGISSVVRPIVILSVETALFTALAVSGMKRRK